MYTKNNEKKYMNVEDAAIILSDTLREVTERRTTLRRALVVSRLALALARTIEVVDLRARVDFLEQLLKKRK